MFTISNNLYNILIDLYKKYYLLGSNMQVIVSGKHLDIGESLRSYIEEKVAKHIKKYFENAIKAHITISKQPNNFFRTDIIVNEGTGIGIVIKSNADESDPYNSAEHAVSKMEKQLQRYKNRIKNHRKNKDKLKHFKATSYVIPTSEDIEDEELYIDAHNHAPVIIAEKQLKVEETTIKDAVMQMDLRNLPAYLFINSTNQHLNLIYYRKDGNLSWVDTGINVNTNIEL